MNPIIPSPAIQVPSDTPISECVALMNEKSIGSLLIHDREAPEQLVGIFTERDLFRNAELIQAGKYWTFPVSSVMSRPVITVEFKHLDQAANLMLDYDFRHLPVVETQLDGVKKLCGIVSIRDVLRARLAPLVPENVAPQVRPAIQLSIHGKNRDFAASITRIVRRLMGTFDVSTLPFTSTEVIPQGLTIIEADGFEPQEIAQLVRAGLAQPHAKAVFIVHGSGMPKRVLKALEDLRTTGKVELFSKPLNLLSLSDAIGRMRLGEL